MPCGWLVRETQNSEFLFCFVFQKGARKIAFKTRKVAERMRRKEVIRNYIHLGPSIGKHPPINETYMT